MFHSGFVLAILAAVFGTLAAFKPAAWVWALTLLWAILFGLLNYDHHRDRVSILNGLRRRDNALIYTKLVDAMLGGLKQMLSPEDAVSHSMPARGRFAQLMWFMTPRASDMQDLKRLQASTLSWPVMDGALKIAVIYPLLLLLVQWGISGQDTGIGTVTILFSEERIWLRTALVCPVVALVITRILASVSQMRVFESAIDWLFVFAAVGISAFAFAAVDTFPAPFAAAFAGAVAAVVAFAAAFPVAGAFTLAAVAAFTAAFAAVGTFPAAFAAVGTFPAVFAAAVGYGCAKGKGSQFYAALVIGLWTFIVVVFSLSAGSIENDGFGALIFALGLLPLINAVFDYLSYGVTLGLIRYGRGKRNFVTGLIWFFDGVVAVLLLIGLGLALSGSIALINHLAGQEFIALRPIFDDLKTPEGRASYTWLTLTLLSTLVPTLVHLVLVFLSAFTWVPQRFKLWIARGVSGTETGDLATLGGSVAAATLGALWAALVACGLWGIWTFVTDYLEPTGLAVLEIVEYVSLRLDWVAPV